MPATASSTDHPAPYQRNGAATPSATSVTIADSTEVPNTDGFLVVSGARHDGNHESCGTAAKSTGMKPADDLSVGDDIDGSTGREDQANPSAPALGLEFYLLFCGLSMAVFLAALDQTIVSVALSAIAEEFDDLAQVPWVGVGYLLTACSVIPSYGQLADVFGRKSMFLFSIFVFELGSTLCGAARSMNPIGAVAALTAVFFLRLPSQARVSEHGSLWRRFRRIDWLGTCLLIATVICLLIPLQGGGTLYPWNSPTVIALFVVGAALLVAFVAVEAFVAPQPVVPLRLYCSAHVVGAFAGAFCLYASYFAVVFYVPLWFEVVRGLSATTAGAHIIPFILGVVIVSITVGVVCTVTGHAYVFMPTSVIPTAIGICLLSTLTESSAQWMEIVYLLIIGIGVGMAIQTNLLVGQAAVPMDMLAVVTAK
ncbi:hypothetical protein HK405_006918 [Cladochytrium tenue]|nr:hypothetical protein HK405_006918 [Cladochytrium tenue]